MSAADMTLEQALALADHASPMPHLAGQALKVLRAHITRGQRDSDTLTALIAELRAREDAGRVKYGTDVDRLDLTNAQWRQHLREELMDALLYSLAEHRTAPLSGVDLRDC